MKAAILTEPGQIELLDRDLPEPGGDEVQIRIDQCGVCTSELDLWEGRNNAKLPAPIGHEISGIVESVGPEVAAIEPGQTVVAWVPGGGFAERVLAPERFCIAVSPDLAYPAVAEPLACVVNAVELTAPRLGDDVLIIGAGYMGSLLQMVTQLKGPRKLIVADVRDEALERASALGATRVVNNEREPLEQAIAEETDGHGVDVTFEVTGIPAGLTLAESATRMSGKLAIVGYHQGEARAIDLGVWNWMAFEVVNAHFRDLDTIMAGMRAGMRLLEAGRIDPAPLITDVYPLTEIAGAFERAASRPADFVKAVVQVGG